MDETRIQVEIVGVVARVWLNRPEVHNAFNAALIADLTTTFDQLGDRSDVRAIVLSGHGKSFSAGGDIEWMKQQGAASVEANAADAQKLAGLFHSIASCPKPTIARVNGAAMGGGVGLVAACDIAIGSSNSFFAMSEVRLGLIPATIAPYVVRAIGERHARCLFHTAERIDGAAAHRIGLLHEVVTPDELDARVDKILEELLRGGPEAQEAAKHLVDIVVNQPIDSDLMTTTAQLIAERRASPEASEGLSAFLEKRPAAWILEKP